MTMTSFSHMAQKESFGHPSNAYFALLIFPLQGAAVLGTGCTKAVNWAAGAMHRFAGEMNCTVYEHSSHGDPYFLSGLSRADCRCRDKQVGAIPTSSSLTAPLQAAVS